MKLTLHIDDAHAPAIIQLLATLIAQTSPVEAPVDPAPGHPELPLESIAARTPKVHFQELPVIEGEGPAIELACKRSAIHEQPEADEDPTRRELPMPDSLPEFPALPHGKTRWVYRGTFGGECHNAGMEREVRYRSAAGRWSPTCTFSGYLHHIEAV